MTLDKTEVDELGIKSTMLVYTLVMTLQEPPHKWMIRPVDMVYVSRLKDVISKNPEQEQLE